jgi:glucokinase
LSRRARARPSAGEQGVTFSPNLHAIKGILLKDRVGPEIGLPLTIENDASAAAWGDFRFGSGSEVDYLVFFTLGTGGGVISHGMLLRGVLLRGAQGSGGELGHVTVRAMGSRCSCGNRGCLEALASGTATGRRAREAAVENPGSALGRSAARRKVLGEDVTELARQGDEVALSVLEETGAGSSSA